MELAKVKSEFEYVRENRRKVERLREQAEALRLSCMARSIQYDKDNVQTSPEDYQAKAIAKAIDLDTQADMLITSGDKNRSILTNWMNVCTDEERIVLINHYFNDMTYREIEFECDDALNDRTYVGAYRYAQAGMKKISESF